MSAVEKTLRARIQKLEKELATRNKFADAGWDTAEATSARVDEDKACFDVIVHLLGPVDILLHGPMKTDADKDSAMLRVRTALEVANGGPLPEVPLTIKERAERITAKITPHMALAHAAKGGELVLPAAAIESLHAALLETALLLKDIDKEGS